MRQLWHIAILALLVNVCHAQVSYEGLELSCVQCSKKTETHCESPFEAKNVLVPCSEVVLSLLLSVKTEREALELVKPRALRNYILKAPSYNPTVGEAIRVLLLTKEGQEDFEKGFSGYLEKYESKITSMLLSEEVPKDVANKIIRSFSSYVLYSAEVRGALMIGAGEEQAELFFEALPLMNLATASSDLRSVSSLIKEASPKLANDMNLVAKALRSCFEGVAMGTLDGRCEVTEDAYSNEASIHYLKRAVMSLVVEELKNEALSTKKRVTLLSSSPYKGYITPDAVKFLDSVLKGAAQSSKELQKALTTGREKELVQHVASLNPSLAPSYSSILINRATSLQNQNASGAAKLLYLSYELDNAYSGARDEVVTSLLPKIKGSELEVELRAYQERTKKQSFGFSTVFEVLGALLLLALGYFGAKKLQNRRLEESKDSASREAYMSAYLNKRAQTREPLAYFELRENATIEDLRKSYLKRVQAVHPDRGGSEEEFLALQEQYAKAKECIVGVSGR